MFILFHDHRDTIYLVLSFSTVMSLASVTEEILEKKPRRHSPEGNPKVISIEISVEI